MSELIIQSRISPSRLHANIIHRESLLQLLSDNLDKNLIVIYSPAGYGKTTLVQEFIHNSKDSNSWLQLSNDIKDFSTFINYIIHSFRTNKKDFGSNTLHLIESIQNRRSYSKDSLPIIDEVVGTFINEFCKDFTEKHLLILDDMSALGEQAWLTSALERIFDIIPDNLTIIITSREAPIFNTSRLAAQRKLFELTSTKLYFGLDDTKKLISDVYNFTYSDKTLNLLDEKLKGWITGLHLLLQAYGKDYEKILLSKKNLPENIFNYFANEIFQKLDKDIQFFLLETSVLNRFDTSICNYLINLKDSQPILNNLLSKNVFIERNSESDLIVFSYIPSFRSFLSTKLSEVRTQKEIDLLYKKIISYYENQGDCINAIEYCLISYNNEKAIELLKQSFDDLFNKGSFELLWRWLSVIDDKTIDNNASLLYYKGVLYRYFMSDVSNAVNYLDRAIELFEKSRQNAMLINCFVNRASLLMYLGRTQEVLNDLLRLKEVKTNHENKARLLYYLGYAYYLNTQYDKSIEYLENALDIANKHNLKIIKYDIFDTLGTIHLNRGNFVKSNFYFDQNYDKPTHVDKKLLTWLRIVELLSQSGQFDKAINELNAAKEYASVFAVPIFELIISVTEMRLFFEAGDFEKSIILAGEANLLAKKFNRKYLTYFTYRILSSSYFYLSRTNKADEYLKLANIYIDETNKFQYFDFKANKALIEFALDPSINIEEILLETYSFFESNIFSYDKAQIKYFLAQFYFRKGQYQLSEFHLKELLKTCSDNEYTSFLEKEYRSSSELLDYAFDKNIHRDYIKLIKTSSLDILEKPWLSDEYRKRVTSSADKTYDIKASLLGEIEFKVRGEVVSEENWKRKVRKLILAYMFLNYPKKLSKDKIIELFFPDSPTESVDNIFHQTVSTIRSALSNTSNNKDSGIRINKKLKKDKSTGKPETQKKKYIIYEDKTLSLNDEFIYCVDTNEFLKYYNLYFANKSDRDENIYLGAKAIGLYKGELLPGFYQSWCEDLRNEFNSKFIKLSESYLVLLRDLAKYEESIIYADKILQFDNLNEHAFLQIIESYVKLDNINRAKDTFANMLVLYDRELGEKPSKNTLDKIQALLI